uniref:ZP domain-containing protein n=2 Tax=Culex tarsalis TaxID=7177 RepID=A0A1Q3FPD4_CULTA
MRVNVVLPSNDTTTNVYLEGMKGYPDPKCKPTVKDTLAEFQLSLVNIYECGVTRVVNKITGKKVFYHRIIIEGDQEFGKEVISVKCITNGPLYNVTHGIVKRDVLPAGFQEPEDLEITSNITGSAPEPSLTIAVRQGENLVSGDLNVSPGTNLQMEIFLDKNSAPIYGLGVNYMQVTDTLTQEETIIFNGCSVDPYLFENFNTVDGDLLTAKFRAFKFPESTFVQFRGTVNVCVDRCKGVYCQGQIAYGRKRREIAPSAADPNKIYEVTMTTFIKVDYDAAADKGTASEIDQKFRQLKLANQKLARNSRAGNVFESIHVSSSKSVPESNPSSSSSSEAAAKVEETILFTREVISQPEQSMGRSGSSSSRRPLLPLLATFVLVLGVVTRL